MEDLEAIAAFCLGWRTHGEGGCIVQRGILRGKGASGDCKMVWVLAYSNQFLTRT